MNAGANEVWGKPLPETEILLADISRARDQLLGQLACQLPCSIKIAIIDDSDVSAKLLLRRIQL